MIDLIIDCSTISNNEILKLKKKFNCFEITDYTGNTQFKEQKFRNILFLTKGNNNTTYTNPNGDKISPLLVKITDKMIWDDNESSVSAKVKTIEDFCNDNIISLIGENYSFNLKCNTKKVTYIQTEKIRGYKWTEDCSFEPIHVKHY
ncbi:MAG: hypothetical protein ACRC5M_04200, partial [Anaeroplasmataceae bacterium]